MRMRMLITVLMFFVFSVNVCAKEFTRDYTYRASDNDSKNTARTNAIEQVKLLLLEEVGVYIQSYVEIDKASDNKNSSAFLSHEINTTTAGITKTQILTEDWNGKEYRLSAKINVDAEDVIKKINDTIKTRANSKNVAEDNRLLKQKDGEIANLSLSLKKKKQDSINQQLRLDKLNAELTLLKVKLDKQIKKERHVLSDLEKIKYRISKSTANANKFTQGMTKNDIIKIAGSPLSEDSCNSSIFLNYGQYWAYLQSGVFKKLVTSSVYEGPCNVKLHSKVTHNFH